MPRKKIVPGNKLVSPVSKRAEMMKRIRLQSVQAQQAFNARQAGQFAVQQPGLQAAQQASQSSPPPIASPVIQPSPARAGGSAFPPPIAPTPQIRVPPVGMNAIQTSPPSQAVQQTKQKQYKAYGVQGGQIGPALPIGGKAALQKIPGPGTKLARAQQAQQKNPAVQKRVADREARRDRLQALGIGQNLASGIQALPSTASSHLETTPTPFGLVLPLLLLILLYFIIIPVNGKSRLEWLYLTIIKQAYVTNAAIQSKDVAQPALSATGTGGYTPPVAAIQQAGGLVVNTPSGSYVYNGGDF